MKLLPVAGLVLLLGFVFAGILYSKEKDKKWVGQGNFENASDVCRFEAVKNSAWTGNQEQIFYACMKLKGWKYG